MKGFSGQWNAFQKPRATTTLQSSPPRAPSTVFLGLMLMSCVRPNLLPVKYAPVSAAIMHATDMKVAMRPTVQCVKPPSATCDTLHVTNVGTSQQHQLCEADKFKTGDKVDTISLSDPVCTAYHTGLHEPYCRSANFICLLSVDLLDDGGRTGQLCTAVLCTAGTASSLNLTQKLGR